MEEIKIILEDSSEAIVNGMFYSYNGIYYFIYTAKELDENGYVILHIVKVGKEIKQTPTGNIETGFMVGVEITNPDEWKNVQSSISIIVNDKKNGTQTETVQFLPLSMLTTIKIQGSKTFRLKREIIEHDFKINLGDTISLNNNESQIDSIQSNEVLSPKEENEVIIDYRTKFFEEQQKNEELNKTIKELNDKIGNIKNIIG